MLYLLNKCYVWSTALTCALWHSEKRIRNTLKVSKNNAGEDQLEQSYENKELLHIVKVERDSLHETNKQTNKRRKGKWIGHIFRKNCLLKHVIEEKLGVLKRRRRRSKLLLEVFKEKTGYWKLKYQALRRTFWRTHFGRGYGPLVRQTAVWWFSRRIKEELMIYLCRHGPCL